MKHRHNFVSEHYKNAKNGTAPSLKCLFFLQGANNVLWSTSLLLLSLLWNTYSRASSCIKLMWILGGLVYMYYVRTFLGKWFSKWPLTCAQWICPTPVQGINRATKTLKCAVSHQLEAASTVELDNVSIPGRTQRQSVVTQCWFRRLTTESNVCAKDWCVYNNTE